MLFLFLFYLFSEYFRVDYKFYGGIYVCSSTIQKIHTWNMGRIESMKME